MCMLAPVLNYSQEPKCLIHVSRVGRRPVTKAKTEETFTQFPPPFIQARAAQTRNYPEVQTRRKIPLPSRSFQPRCRCGQSRRSDHAGKIKQNNSHIKCFQFNRPSRERKKQHEHFPRVDLCDSVTLNILSPEQAQLPSNRCSRPLMRLARGQPALPALLIARLKSLYLIAPVIQKGIIPRGCLSKKPNWFFGLSKTTERS